jgi:hypothetical protein
VADVEALDALLADAVADVAEAVALLAALVADVADDVALLADDVAEVADAVAELAAAVALPAAATSFAFTSACNVFACVTKVGSAFKNAAVFCENSVGVSFTLSGGFGNAVIAIKIILQFVLSNLLLEGLIIL